MRWPLVFRKTYDSVKTENWCLRDALREANSELRRHRMLIGGLKSGHVETIRAVERVLSERIKPKEKA